MSEAASRMPVAFLTHGGGPWPIVDIGVPGRPDDERGSLLKHLGDVRHLMPTPPKALVVISAHWEAPVPTVMSAAYPPMLFDYSGFPPEAYALTWPAPGSPGLAARVRDLLARSGFSTGEDTKRGFDHGTFIPLKVAFPNADVPVVQLSLIAGLDAKDHLKMGRALAPLRDEGVFIIGTGNSFHNLGALRAAMRGSAQGPRDQAATFDAWLRATVTATPAARDERLGNWQDAPFGRQAHPREEHLVPLMVVAGAAGRDAGVVTWSGSFVGMKVSSFHFG